MRRDIFGNVIVTSSDYVSMISDELSFSKKYKLIVALGIDQLAMFF